MCRPLLVLAAVLLVLPTALPTQAQERPKNVVLFIADGFGPASATFARTVADRPLSFDSLLVGSVGTAATDSEVTDSAASATAYACGQKSYNGAIAVTPDSLPCPTVLERAEARGLATGLVATSRVTHATPAAFASHVAQRSQEDEIARQLTASGVEVLFGGGAAFFVENDSGSDLTVALADAGYAVARDGAAFDGLDSVPAVALLADSHVAYEIDRDETDQPSLAAMTQKALHLLSESDAGRDNGFFLMVEGSRIDHAGHGNDPAAHYQDILAFDAAIAAALAFARKNGETLIISTADHETGGLALGRDGVYAWDPAFIRGVTVSVGMLAARVQASEDPEASVEAIARDGLGLDSLTAVEVAALHDAAQGQAGRNLGGVFADIASRRAGVGWTTGGHTGVDVGLYAYGPGAETLGGHLENDALGRRLFALLGLDPDPPGTD